MIDGHPSVNCFRKLGMISGYVDSKQSLAEAVDSTYAQRHDIERELRDCSRLMCVRPLSEDGVSS